MNLFAFGFGYSIETFARSAPHHTVTGTVREAAKIAALAARGMTAIPFDDHARVREALARSDAVLVSIPPGAHDPVLATYDDELASRPGVPIVYLSTIGVYGDADGAWIDEAAPLVPTSDRNRARVTAEAKWAAMAARTQSPLAILRLAGIYGPGRNALRALRDGTARRIIKPGQVFNRIHVEDIAQPIAAALERRASGTWNVTDDEPSPPGDVVTFAAGLLNVTPPAEVPFDTAVMSPMARSFYGSNKRVRNARLKRDLSVTLRFPTYREGLRSLWQAGEGVA